MVETRSKRTLEEADPNATESSPKKTPKGSGKENDRSVGKQKSSSPKPRPSQTDNSQRSPRARKKRQPSYEAPEYICIPRPWFDRKLEHGEDHNDMGEAEAKKMTELLKKPADEHPDWHWILSKEADKLWDTYMEQAEKRDQDAFALYFYNDFVGYGLQEVIENMLVAFEKEYRPKNPSPIKLWILMETMAHWFVKTENIDQWLMLEDGERVTETAALIGSALLSALDALERAGLLKKDSPIRNIPLILSLWFHFIPAMSDAMDPGDGETQIWPNQVVAYAKKHGIEIKGVYGIEKTVQRYEALDEKDRDFVNASGGDKSNDKWRFKEKFQKFLHRYGYTARNKWKRLMIGGDQHDIMKMSKADRKQHAFENKDPLEDMVRDHGGLRWKRPGE